MDFYERVKEEAKKNGLTLNILLDINGINYDTYKSLKRQGLLPRADDTLKIAHSLETTVEYLITGEHNYYTKQEFNNCKQGVIEVLGITEEDLKNNPQS